MKKQLFTLLSALSVGAVMAQTASPSWPTLQSPSFTIPIAGTRFIDAVDPNVVWLAGYDGQAPNLNYNFFSRTTNGGATYTSGNVFSDTNTYALSNLEGLDANTAWVCAYNKSTGGSGVIYRTTNGGSSWTNMTAPGMYTNSASFGNWIAFLSPSVAVVNGDPVNNEFELWRTADGGSTFTVVPGANIPDPQSNEYAIVDMYATFGPSHIWFGTNQGRVYRSFDAGVTWSVSNVSAVTSQTSSVIEVRFASATNGLALIFQNNAYALYNTYNGGASWNLIPGGTNSVPNNYGVNEMAAIPGTNYFASAGNGNGTTGFQGLSYSKDNGVTWTDWGSVGIGYTTIDFADRWHGWAGSFTNFPDTSWPGIFKYEGFTFNAEFSIPQSVCMGSTNVTITPVNNSGSANPPLTFNWTSNPAAQFSNPTASVPVITFTNVGTYTVVLAAGDANGTSTLSQVISVASCSPPAASFTMPSTGCNNQFLTLSNTSTGGPAPSVTITANPSNNVVISGGSGNQYSLNFGDPGTYTVTLFASSISGTSSATQTVLINDCRPALNFDVPASVCRTDTVFTNNTSLGPIITHTWSILPNTGVLAFNPVGTGTLTNRRIIFNPQVTLYSSYTVTLKATNAYGVTELSKVITIVTPCNVGVNEVAAWAADVKLYPNPAHERINLVLPAKAAGYSVKVLNVLGAVVHQEKVAGNTATDLAIELDSFRKGVYFVEIRSGSETATRKFIVD